ncbi:MAG: hypothetical protein ABIF82_00135 [Planctomycetota bacterium]
MAPRQICKHERARFYAVQRLGKQPPVELWQCPACKSTVSAESLGKKRRTAAA